MSIQVNTGATAVNWEGLLSKLGDVEKTKDVSGKETLTLTMNVDGDKKVCTISVPNDLEVPQKVDAAALNNVIAKLQESGLKLSPEQMETFKQSLVEASTMAASAVAEAKGSSKRGVMFDLYALMALLVEVAQKQRDAAREMRNSENMTIRTAIQNQANEQRTAAWIGIGLGLGFGILSMAASAVTMFMQGRATKQQMSVAGNSEVGAASMKVKMLKAADTSAHAKEQLTSVTNKLEKVGGETGKIPDTLTREFNGMIKGDSLSKEYTEARQTLIDAKGEAKQATGELKVAEAAKNDAQKKYDTMSKLFGRDNLNKKLEGLVKRQSDLKDAGDTKGAEALQLEIDNTRGEFNKVEDTLKVNRQALEDATKAYESAIAKDTNATAKLETARKGFEGAKQEYIGTIKGFSDKYEGQYKSALQRLNNAPDDAAKATLKGEVANAKKEMEMAHALAANELAKPGVLTTAERLEIVNSAENESFSAVNSLNQNEKYKALGNDIQFYMGLNGIIQAVGGMLQSVTQNGVALQQSFATRLGAAQKEQEEMLDQTKDLFQQAQKLVDAAVQLMNAVRQAETQSMRDAIQA